MDIAGFHIPAVVGTSATFAAVYAAFSRFETIQSEKNKKFVSAWLLGLTAPNEGWYDFILEIFTRIFGENHWSRRALFRSFALTICLMVVVDFEYLLTHHALLSTLRIAIWGPPIYRVFPVLFVVIGCVGDYLSLWKMRLLLTRISAMRRGWNTVAWVIVDLFATIAFVFSLRALFFVFFMLYSIYRIPIYAIVVYFYAHQAEAIRLMFSDDAGPLFIVALLTSAWLWAYLIVAQIIRLAALIPRFVRLLGQVADLKNHPVRVLGFVTACISALGVTVAQIAFGL